MYITINGHSTYVHEQMQIIVYLHSPHRVFQFQPSPHITFLHYTLYYESRATNSDKCVR